jgi:hypothetical protein
VWQDIRQWITPEPSLDPQVGNERGRHVFRCCSGRRGMLRCLRAAKEWLDLRMARSGLLGPIQVT